MGDETPTNLRNALQKLHTAVACRICDRLLEKATRVHCSHVCEDCVAQRVDLSGNNKSSVKCPFCEEKVKKSSLLPHANLDFNLKFIAPIVKLLSPESGANNTVPDASGSQLSKVDKNKNRIASRKAIDHMKQNMEKKLKDGLLAVSSNNDINRVTYVKPSITSTPAASSSYRPVTTCVPVTSNDDMSEGNDTEVCDSDGVELDLKNNISYKKKGKLFVDHGLSVVANGFGNDGQKPPKKALQSIGVQCSLKTKSQSQQTDSYEDDIYIRLSKLFTCLCTDRGIEGSIVVEGIGRFEIKLSKSKSVSNEENVEPNDIPHSQVFLSIDEGTQTFCDSKSVLIDKYVNTSQKEVHSICCQTEKTENVLEVANSKIDCSDEISSISSSPIDESQPCGKSNQESDLVDDLEETGDVTKEDSAMSSLSTEETKLYNSLKLPACDMSPIVEEPAEEEILKIVSDATGGGTGTENYTIDTTGKSDTNATDADEEPSIHVKKFKRIREINLSDDEQESSPVKKNRRVSDELGETNHSFDSNDSLEMSPFTTIDDQTAESDCIPPSPPPQEVAKNRGNKAIASKINIRI